MLCLVSQSRPTLCDPIDCSPPGFSAHGDSPGKNAEVGCHTLLQGIFPTQRSNPDLLHCRQILYLQWPSLLEPHNYIISLWHCALMTETLPEILWFETLSQFFANWSIGVFFFFLRWFYYRAQVWLLAIQKPIKRPSWWKRKFASYWMQAIWGR